MEQFLANTQHQLALIVEHHLPQHKLQAVRNSLQHANWRTTASVASSTGRSISGTSGGAIICTRSNLRVNAYAERAPAPGCAQLQGVGMDWAEVVLRMKGMNLLVVCLYLTTGKNASSIHVTKLSEVITFIKHVVGHYVILADWNMAPEELVRWGVLQTIGREIQAPGRIYMWRLQSPHNRLCSLQCGRLAPAQHRY